MSMTKYGIFQIIIILIVVWSVLVAMIKSL